MLKKVKMLRNPEQNWANSKKTDGIPYKYSIKKN